MVLDEDALEAMLRRQNGEAEDTPERPKAELTDETEEFEVYERSRPADEPAVEETGVPDPAPVSDDGEPFEELPGRQPQQPTGGEAPATPAPPGPAPRPDPVPEPAEVPATPQPAQEETPAPPAPEAPPQASPQMEPETQPETEPAPRRPRVWPPIGDEERSHKPPEPAAHEETARTPPAQEQETAHEAPTPRPGSSVPTAAGTADGSGCRLAIVQATFNAEITDMMADIATKRADQTGCTVTHTAQVAGVYDLPLTAKHLADRDDVDAVVVLGAVVQGETQHDLVITQSTAATLQRVALETGKPIGFGVTGPGMTWGQAEARVVNAKHAVDAAVAQWRAIKTA